MTACPQEMCPNWSGDGAVCPCAALGIDPPCPLCGAELGSTDYCPSCEQFWGGVA
jgi:hypothetical protein